MNTDVATLQNIADTLKEEPMASQRVLAENAGMSIGLMNAVIKRFVERGWIMLTNVNLRKFSYAITPAGIAELTARSQTFAKRTFAIANKYNETLCQAVSDAKKEGKNKLVLYGNSYIKFLVRHNERYELRHSGYNKIMNPPCLSGCFMFMRLSTLKENNLFFDERFFMYCEDFDLMRRIHRVAKTVYYPNVTVVHNHAKESYKMKKSTFVQSKNTLNLSSCTSNC